MRVVLDTNILLSALINPHGVPAELIVAWREQRFALVTSIEQLVELGDVARRPVLRARIVPARVGRFIHDLRRFAEVLRRLPQLDRSADPADNFLLPMAQVGNADYLVSGDRRGVLALKSHGVTRIVPARELLKVLGVPQAPRSSRPKRKK
ncbi:MAG: putative toxin-antitoxin system toxin component, PIN family [Steroidobacterales bacterium]